MTRWGRGMLDFTSVVALYYWVVVCLVWMNYGRIVGGERRIANYTRPCQYINFPLSLNYRDFIDHSSFSEFMYIYRSRINQRCLDSALV